MDRTTDAGAGDRAARPLLVYDGECGFCLRWIRRWRWRLGDRVAPAPSQEVGDRVPGVDAGTYRRTVVLFEPATGRVSTGAEAVFRALAARRGGGLPLLLHRFVPGVRAVTERVYRLVADHRPLAARIDGWLVGERHVGSTWRTSRALFVRGVGLVALVAFVSLWVQVHGLCGTDGVVPAERSFAAIREAMGRTPWLEMPSLLWLGAGDGALHVLCAAGAAVSLLVLLGVLPALGLLGAAVLYMSLVHGAGVFLRFQWDSLLIEAGLLAALYAPWSLRLGRRAASDPAPPALARWLVWWLLFRLMFESGVVKWTWGDASWRDLTALAHYYWTQPLPHAASVLVHHLPLAVHKVSTLAMFVVEVALPFLIVGPRRVRHAAAFALLALQAMIAGTGNYGFFNLLAGLLCLSLLDDQALSALRLGRRPKGDDAGPERGPREGGPKRLLLPAFALVPITVGALHLTELSPGDRAAPEVEDRSPGAAAVHRLAEAQRPFLAVNSYGLFRVMTKSRPEIRVQVLPEGAAAADADAWVEVDFRWKPDADLAQTPRWVQPHMPRLDWRLWFEALRWEPFAERGVPYARGASPWFRGFLERLLEAEPDVHALLGAVPLDGATPRAVRAQLFDYRFTTPAERDETGAVWHATPLDARGIVVRAGR